MSDHSNLEDYTDPLIYDAENADFAPDGPFYLRLAQRLGGPVLDLGCGTGRISLPLAQHGIAVTGLDAAPAMLERAKHKAADLPITWIEADMRAFDLKQQFRLICATGGAFQMLLSRADHEAALGRIHAHLAPEGYFAIDLAIPQPAWMQRVDDEQEWFSYVTEDGRNVQVSGTEYYDPLSQVKHETITRRWRTKQGEERAQIVRFAFRYLFPQELEALLHYNRFRIVHRAGDPMGAPTTQASERLYYLCQPS